MFIDHISRRLQEMARGAAREESVQKIITAVVPSALDFVVKAKTGNPIAGSAVKNAAKIAAEADPEKFASGVMQVVLPIAAPCIAAVSLPVLAVGLVYQGVKKLGE